MTADERKKLVVGVLRDCNLEWWIAAAGGEDKIVEHLAELMTKFSQCLAERCRLKVEPFSVFELYAKRPTQVRAFLQAAASTSSAEMLVMTWRIIQGMDIKHVSLNYEMEQSFSLSVELRSPYSESETYQSANIDDAALLRHFGIMKMDGAPVFDGFYPLFLGESASPRSEPQRNQAQLKSLRTALEIFMEGLFRQHLQIRKLEQQDAFTELVRIPGDHRIDLDSISQEETAYSEVNRPLDLARNYAEIWNKEVRERKPLRLHHEEHMVAFVGTCIAKALQQLDVIEGNPFPREPSFAGRFFHEVRGMPWEA